MPTPFPGMDPYLERPDLWPDVHNRLIVSLADELAPRLRPRYYVAIEERTYLAGPEELLFSGRPDVAVVDEPRVAYETATAVGVAALEVVPVELPLPDYVRETYLQVRAVETDKVITVIEILSPSNKRPGEGRNLYEHKRLLLLGTLTHLVEIDLLRAGEPMTMTVRGDVPPGHYRILISHAEKRPTGDLLAFSVRRPIPAFRLPLQKGDEAPLVDLNQLLHALYDRAGYDLRVDYRAEADPPLEGEDAAWAGELLRQASRR
ncbi:MAG: DUF4058 family protein [Chloroflexota bacterium]